jgi:hypothetical protein
MSRGDEPSAKFFQKKQKVIRMRTSGHQDGHQKPATNHELSVTYCDSAAFAGVTKVIFKKLERSKTHAVADFKCKPQIRRRTLNQSLR